MKEPAKENKQHVRHLALQEELNENGCSRIAVVGVGEVGNDTINHLMDARIAGVKYVAINTDAQQLDATRATQKLLIGENVTRGLSSSPDRNVGQAAALEFKRQVEDAFPDLDIVFISAGLEEGTGLSVAPQVAEIARCARTTVIGVVTMPLQMKKRHVNSAVQGLTAMRRHCDTVVVIDKDKLKRSWPQLSEDEVLKAATQVTANTINEMVETILEPGLTKLDFGRFREIVKSGGVAIVGIGESTAPNRAEEAVVNALRNPSLDVDCSSATGALIHVAGDEQMTTEEVRRVGEIVTEMMHENALVSWGARVNPSLPGILRVTLVMTGIKSPYVHNDLSMIASNLYDMDSQLGPDKPLRIDLDLYQLENF